MWADETRRLAERLGLDRSEVLRDALHRDLIRLRAEQEVESWTGNPLTADGSSLAAITDWGLAEDWTEALRRHERRRQWGHPPMAASVMAVIVTYRPW